MNASGHVCTPTTGRPLARHRLQEARFETTSLCWASGVELSEGVRYRVILEMTEPWTDGVYESEGRPGIPSGLAGFGLAKTTGPMFVGLPFRRYVGENWFKPIARIGSKGTDEYVLNAGDTLIENAGRRLVTEITARRTGELFLFVNDSVFGLPPSFRQPTYENNRGAAAVTVVPVTLAP